MKKALIVAMLLLVPVMGMAQKRGGNNKKKQAPKSDPQVDPWTEPDKDYTLKVKLLVATHITENSSTYISVKTHGSGNVLGATMMGFDYKSSCAGGLASNTADESSFYEAKWKSQDKKIEVLGKPEGSDKKVKCTLDVEMKEHPYRLPAAAAPAADATSATPADAAPAKTEDVKPAPPEGGVPAGDGSPKATDDKPAPPETSTPQ